MPAETREIPDALSPVDAIAKARRYIIENEEALVPLTPLDGMAALSDVYHAIDSSTYEVAPSTMEFLATLGTRLARAAVER